MDLYEKLGVSKTATKKEIQSAYRRLSKLYHPDMQHGKSDKEKKEAEEKFKDISEAANILMDDEKRQRYDQFGTVDENAQRGFDPFEMFRSHFGGMGGFGDFFGFGGMRQDPNAPIEGDDIQVVVSISFKQSINGCKKKITISNEKICTKCNGTGSADGKTHTCSVCHGSGMEFIHRGNITQSFPCRTCHGSGKGFSSPCSECHGEGVVSNPIDKEIEVPAGIESRNAIGIRGLGKAGKNGGPNGTLVVIFSVEVSDIFERTGLDVHTHVYLTPFDLMYKDEVDVIDPYGEKVHVKIPNNFDSSKTLRVRNHGIKGQNGICGDLYVRLYVCKPNSISKQMNDDIINLQKKDLSKYNQIEEYNNQVEKYLNEKV